MAENALDRTPRSEETREKAERAPIWRRPELLPVPDPIPGWVFHWVRVSMMGQNDARNVSSKLREGWEPCLAKDHPECYADLSESENFADNIVIGGLMLCKAPKEIVDQRNAYYAGQAKSQIHAVDNSLMAESDARMPLFNERKSDVTFGNDKR